ncbi:DUF4180 domain-containing protein [Clostridium paraputrificum]|uniref:DUF4180 domain-containing protein n=1 Tax=Clostridium paraputrificum TaxID=29363 RepID=UPI003D34A7D3
MKYRIVEKDNKKYIMYEGDKKKISTENDVIDIVSTSFEHDTGLIIINSKALSEDFFNLRTGLAGVMLQKFINYHIKFVILLDNKEDLSLRFKELVGEANRGNEFRVVADIAEGEKWLLI